MSADTGWQRSFLAAGILSYPLWQEGLFAWLPSVPTGVVNVTLALNGETIRLNGTGYHDHNQGIHYRIAYQKGDEDVGRHSYSGENRERRSHRKNRRTRYAGTDVH